MQTFGRGSLVHDALYQLMRQGHIKGEANREKADKLLHDICIADGMWRARAWWVYRAVRMFGRGSSVGRKRVRTAPEAT